MRIKVIFLFFMFFLPEKDFFKINKIIRNLYKIIQFFLYSNYFMKIIK